MKKFTFKILFIVLAVVLIGAAGLVIALTSRMADATAMQDIRTAVSESTEKASSEATPPASSLSAETLRMLVQEKEYRRSYIIPTLDSVVIPEAETWESIRPENLIEIKGRAVSKTNEYAKGLFGHEITDTGVDFKYYTDTSKHRGDIVKISAIDDTIVCTLAADTLDLIEIDYYFIPERPMDSPLMEDVEIERQISEKVAELFGTGVSARVFSGGGEGDEYHMATLDLTLENGKFVKIAALNNELYAVGVYPTKACMTECVYFEADVQRDESIIKLVSPQNFAVGEPGEGDMTKDEALAIYGKFLDLANGVGNYPEPAATFFIDNSGARENYWHLAGAKLTVDIASKSKWLVSLNCDGLWNPEKDLTKIPYESMGGSEYEGYVRSIMSGIYGSSLVKVTNNAVYDYHFCTEDAVMADGAWYEFYFEDGKLMEVWYFYNDFCFRYGPSGWKADNTYINTVTGEEFMPQ